MLALRQKMSSAPLRIPRFEAAEARFSSWFGAAVFRVTSEGHAADLHFEPGDLLVIDQGGVSIDDLVVLVPQRRGRPMLGRMTREGLVSEPGRVPVALNTRWHVAGRIIMRVRTNPRRGGQVLRFPDRGEAAQQQLEFADPSQIADDLYVHIVFERAPARDLVGHLGRRLPGFRMIAPDEALVDGGELFTGAPMDVLSSLVAELRVEFGLKTKAVRTEARGTAMAVLGRLPFDAVACVRPGARYAAPPRRRSGSAPAMSEPELEKKQLGLFGEG
ncbi:MAG TPA: hypothetical protein QGF58_07465 [Myxococcota bacterium]|nr:hypothetical protein [Myxococcota bacterium]